MRKVYLLGGGQFGGRVELQWGRTLSSAERQFSFRPDILAPLASMGPHSFKCGKFLKKELMLKVLELLQWGRTLSSAERCVPFFNFSRCASLLQWGRTLSSAESRRSRTARSADHKASMGPHSFKCGKFNLRSSICGVRSCFNGAALFQVRKAELRPLNSARPKKLQWGRTLSSAESSAGVDGTDPVEVRFNGAALFQVRKVIPAKSTPT